MLHTNFLYNPNGKGSYCHCPTILESQSGDLLVAWYTYPQQEHAGATLALVRKPKSQNRWLPTESWISSNTYSVGNPVLFQEPEGRIWLLFVVLKGNYWNDAVLEGTWSDDDGKTWSQPIQLWKKHGLMVRHPPLLLDGHTLLLPAYEEKSRRTVLLSRSLSEEDWKESYRFPGLDLIQPALVREAGGRLSLYFRPCGNPRRIWRSHSNCQGRSWSTPVRTTLPNPFSGISAFVAGERTFVVHNHTEKHQRFPLSISFTRDGGVTWEKSWHFENITHEVSYPSFLTGRDGIIHGVYTYNRRMIKYIALSSNHFS
ncbi:MAG: exo-alpha-sialidase [Nitrospinaceae bacterium]